MEMVTKLTFVCLCFIINIISIQSARILAVFPTPSISHQVVFRPVTQELARRGHDVVVLTTDPAFPKEQAPANLTEIDLHDRSYALWNEIVTKSDTIGKKEDMFTQLEIFLDIFSKIFEQQMQMKEVRDIINNKNEKFDLLLVEACVRPALAFAHKYKAPMAVISSFGPGYGNLDAIGATQHPLVYPSYLKRKIYNLTFWEKIQEVYNFMSILELVKKREVTNNELVKRIFGPDTPSLLELGKNNIDLLLLNLHSIWDHNRPVPPGVVYIGGIHQKPTQELPTDLKSYLDSSANGVIYVSFGTNVNPTILPPTKIESMLNVFSRLPYDVLMKWDTDELNGRSKNIRISKWLPQSDLLKHPKLKLFINQGGLQSTDESITAGVPMIGIPMLADQWFHSEHYVHFNIGMKLDIETLNEKVFEEAIYNVVKNDSYRLNVARLRSLMYDQPQTPLERAVWWIEHVIKHGGGRHLRSAGSNLTIGEYYEVKVLMFLFAVLLSTLILIGVSLYKLCKFVFGSTNSIKVKIN